MQERKSEDSHSDTGHESDPLQPEKSNLPKPPKYYKHAMFILIAYVPLIIVPWALTCIISIRPLGLPSYYVQRGFTDAEVDRIHRWITIINAFNSIGSLLTIPVLSALIAQAASVYSYQQKARPSFHPKHLAALADRGWTNPWILGRSWMWKEQGSRGVRYLLHFAAIVVVVGSIQQPLYQILVPTEFVLVPTCRDTMPLTGSTYDVECQQNVPTGTLIGWDIEPGEMNQIDQIYVLQRLVGDLAKVSVTEVNAHVWSGVPDPKPPRQRMNRLNGDSFVATLEQGTTTGVLREHIMRLNSTVGCRHIKRSEYPSVCKGEQPFVRSFSHDNNYTRICVPGKFGYAPWTMSRSRQDIFEELYLDVVEELVYNLRSVDQRILTSNFTVHCTSTTTRGYFELGNYRNNFTWQPLLDKWPSQEELRAEFNGGQSPPAEL
ncbi:hypothetical protein DM02DRAFT_701786 [Periconia macrospinosa]|uniref:Uncharacterized protein n=1 Tax=Periconia macrospinosa TaxID=97972 RepID=A0A2V1D485_9PLEO|nr:hypothetical protein DM02DRAFT_701786 [Periconia macrospinosa]